MTNNDFKTMLLKKNLNRYLQSKKTEKGKLLDSFERDTGMHRKAIIRLLGKMQKGKKLKRGGSKPKYKSSEKELIELVWETNDYICAERLEPQIEKTITRLKRFGYLKTYTEKTTELIRNIPLGTLKEKLGKMVKPRHRRWMNSQGEIRKIVPIRTNFKKINKVGYIGVDFVDHTGGDASGKYARTLCCTEIVTQWITRRATKGRDKMAVEKVVERSIKRIPFHVYELHSDNETNLIHSLLKDFGKRRKIAVTRTRSYHSQDNGHVEQKNGDKIRNLVGYYRYDKEREIRMLNEIYRIDDQLQNHFIGSQRLIKKEYDKRGKLRRKVHDKAQTPYERVMKDKSVSPKVKITLCQKNQRLDPLKLKRQRDKLLKKLSCFR